MTLLLGPAARADDPWFGPDKGQHFAAGALVAFGAAEGAALFTGSARARLGFGASAALLAGAGKELFDFFGHGDPSWRDLAWDALGAAAGVLLAWVVDELLDLHRPRRVLLAPWLSGGSLGLRF